MKPTCCIFEDPPDPPVQQELNEHGCLMVALKSTRDNASPGSLSYQHLVSRQAGTMDLAEFEDSKPALIIHGSGSSGR